MKDEETQLTEWTQDAILFDWDDGPGITRVYTRAAWSSLWETIVRWLTTRPDPEEEKIPGNTYAAQLIADRVPGKLKAAIDHLDTILKKEGTKEIPPDVWRNRNIWLRELYSPRSALRFRSLDEAAGYIDQKIVASISQAIKQAEFKLPSPTPDPDIQSGGR